MKKTVIVTGSFDVIHIGHIRLFEFAAEYGNPLIVLLDTDERVREHKGNDRPMFSLEVRKEVLESIRLVDRVLSFYSDDHLKELLQQLPGHIRIVGEDYKNREVIGREFADQIIYFDFRVSSTTEIIKKLNDNET